LDAGDVVADRLDGGIELGLAPSADEDVRAFLDKPIPVVPPVITAVLPLSSAMIVPFVNSGPFGQ
jgi:hypothetical protein